VLAYYPDRSSPLLVIRNWVPWLGGQSELGAAALLKAVWRDFRLKGLLTHLLARL